MNLGEGIAEQARAEGRKEAWDEISALYRRLFTENKAGKLNTAQLRGMVSHLAEDEEYRKKLFAEYGIE